MSQDKIRKWVENKLESGVDPERLKKSLEETEHDPSIVDEIKQEQDDPFGAVDVEGSPFEKESAEEEKTEGSNHLGNARKKGGDQEKGFSDNGGEENSFDAGSGYKDKDKDKKDNKSGVSPLSMSSFSLPSVSFPSIGFRPVYLVSVVLILLVGGAGMFLLDQGSQNDQEAAPVSDTDRSLLDPKCPDVGVRINSAEVTNGRTVAEVLVTRGTARVVLEIYSEGEVVGSKTEEVGGTTTLEVDAGGDRAVFRPVGCTTFSDETALN